MEDGIYYAHFYTDDGSASGDGIVVFRDHLLNGGDHGYTYKGRFIRNEDGADLVATIERWNPEVESVFGDLQNYEIKFSGNYYSNNYKKTVLKAKFSEYSSKEITVELTHLSPLNK